jgi:hypothetical protein
MPICRLCLLLDFNDFNQNLINPDGGRWSVVGGRWSVVGGRWSVAACMHSQGPNFFFGGVRTIEVKGGGNVTTKG